MGEVCLSKPSETGATSWRFGAVSLSTWTLLLMLLVLSATLGATGGSFGYSLDDPYIHLAMAEEILAGGYGVNASEPAAASSSIVFPFLVAGLLALGAGDLAPLLVAWLSTLVSVWLATAVFQSAGVPGPMRLRERSFIIPAVFVLVANLAGLAFTGMEHSLHLAMTLAALLGVVRFGRAGKVDAWWIVVLCLQPLVRYEGLGVAAAGALVLLLRGRFGLAALVAASSGAIVLAFAAWLMSLGLPPLPSSVMVKGSDVAGADGIAGKTAALIDNFSQNISEQSGFVFLVLALMFAFAAAGRIELQRRGDAESRAPDGVALTAAFMAVILFGHLLAGRFGWAQRYEAYAFVTALAALPAVFQERAARTLAGRDGPVLALGLIVLLLAFAPNVRATLESPEGSRNIFLQQRQMQRLAVEHVRAPVAVNDLGWVSYQNPSYVLDLWGLGSERARKARAMRQGPGWMEELASEHGVRLIMIYDAWLEEHPAEWVRLGSLTFRGKLVTPAHRDVAIYAADPAHVPELNGAIREWASTLPERAHFSPDVHENPGYGPE